MMKKAVLMSGFWAISALFAVSPAAAQASDPGGFVCALVNFRFCDQPTEPLPGPQVVLPRSEPVNTTDHRRHRRKQTTAPDE